MGGLPHPLLSPGGPEKREGMRMGGEWRGQSTASNTPTQEPPGAGALVVPGTVCLAPVHPSFSELAPTNPKLCPGE